MRFALLSKVNHIVAYNTAGTFPNGWLAFELSVLRRLKFASVALPLTGEPDLCVYLKHWKARVATNDPMLWAFTKATALVENPSALKWFTETDACWFDNVRFNAERLASPYKRALALTVGMMVGDYVLSFDEETRQLREPLSLSKVFRQMAETLPYPIDNSLRNKSANQDVRAFVAERQHTDLLFLRLPAPLIKPKSDRDILPAWREEWLQGSDDFWDEFEKNRLGMLGSHVQSKQQYLGFVADLLQRAAQIPAWAIMHTENGFISSDELVETVTKIRKVDAIYTKDFSDLLGIRASIVTAVT